VKGCGTEINTTLKFEIHFSNMASIILTSSSLTPSPFNLMLCTFRAVAFYVLLAFPATARSLVFALLNVPAIHCSHHHGVIYYIFTFA
jgi:hypothetical protein